jgi:hypothetical protein
MAQDARSYEESGFFGRLVDNTILTFDAASDALNHGINTIVGSEVFYDHNAADAWARQTKGDEAALATAAAVAEDNGAVGQAAADIPSGLAKMLKDGADAADDTIDWLSWLVPAVILVGGGLAIYFYGGRVIAVAKAALKGG